MSLTLCVLGGNARADANSSMVLDYEATAEGCPDAGRFADEVSSKLGFVPWNGQALSTLRIRIRAEGGELVGTLELPDGSSKILRDSTCAPLFSALATAASVALDSASAAAAPVQNPAQITAPASRKATVHVESTGSNTIVSLLESQVSIVGSNGASAHGVSWKEVCLAPCSFKLEPGIHNVMVYGDGPASVMKINLSEGEQTQLEVEPGSNALVVLGTILLYTAPTVALLGGLSYLAQDDPGIGTVAVALGGVAATGLGIGMIRWGATDFNQVSSAPPPQQVTARTVTYSGTF